jgi:hypothetical protein
MKWLALLFALFFVLPAFAQSGAPATPLTPSPDDRAKQWLSLVDDGNGMEAWKQAASVWKDKAPQDGFVRTLKAMREPLGAMTGRSLKDVKLVKTLPGMRDGQYAVVRFDSTFARKASAVETLTLISENGAWSVVDYHVG